jgi:hypothetical protein
MDKQVRLQWGGVARTGLGDMPTELAGSSQNTRKKMIKKRRERGKKKASVQKQMN